MNKAERVAQRLMYEEKTAVVMPQMDKPIYGYRVTCPYCGYDQARLRPSKNQLTGIVCWSDTCSGWFRLDWRGINK